MIVTPMLDSIKLKRSAHRRRSAEIVCEHCSACSDAQVSYQGGLPGELYNVHSGTVNIHGKFVYSCVHGPLQRPNAVHYLTKRPDEYCALNCSSLHAACRVIKMT